jgi:hypothetical protein
MTDSKAKKQPKQDKAKVSAAKSAPAKVIAAKSAPAKGKKISGAAPSAGLTGPSADLIRERAFELYKSRGGEDGADEQDWLRAEQEILGR